MCDGCGEQGAQIAARLTHEHTWEWRRPTTPGAFFLKAYEVCVECEEVRPL